MPSSIRQANVIFIIPWLLTHLASAVTAVDANLLSHVSRGFEDLSGPVLRGMELKKGKDVSFGGWQVRAYKGEVHVAADRREGAGGRSSLRIEMLSANEPAGAQLITSVRPVKPNTMYEAYVAVKPYAIDWMFSNFRFFEYRADGEQVNTVYKEARLVNTATWQKFRRRSARFLTHPQTARASIFMSWQGRRRRDGIILERSFETDLRRWILAEPGAGDANNPRISCDRAHGGSGSLDYDGARTWDGSWRTSVNRGPDGWVVEMAIPWETIGVEPSKVYRMGLHFARKNRPTGSAEPLHYMLGGRSTHEVSTYERVEIDLR